MNAQIAQHLNIAESAIVRIEEWAKVLFVVCKKIGARFVSKKVVTMNIPQPTVNRYGHNVWELDGAKVEQMSDGFCPTFWADGYYALIPEIQHKRIESLEVALQLALEARKAFENRAPKAVITEKQKNRAFAIASGMVQTSTGEWVDESDWLEAQENGIDL